MLLALSIWLLLAGCERHQGHPEILVDVLNGMTPVKDQGQSQTCWAYAMLAAIETEHIGRGDSVNLSPAYVEYMLRNERRAPANQRGMGVTCINMIQRYGLCAYDAYRECSDDVAPPRQVFMLGAVYTPQEFARSVCAPGEYVALTSQENEPYDAHIEVETDDNWEHNRFWNVPMDTLLAVTERAVRQHRGVCWESEGHAMAIVGLGHTRKGTRCFIIKNSWGDRDEDHGLVYLSYRRFVKETLAVELPREVLGQK